VPCAGEESHWIAFKYERLNEYCTGYGFIGHNNRVCPAPQQLIPPDKYSRPLRASSYVSPRLVSKVQQEDFDSSISLAAFVGNSPSSVVPSQMLDSHGSTHSQLVTIANKIDFPIPSPNVFSMQHMVKSCSLVSAQPNQLLPNQTSYSPTEPDKGMHFLSFLPTKYAESYPSINAPTCHTPSQHDFYSLSPNLTVNSFSPNLAVHPTLS
jgi:hypothetical protein